MNGIIVNKNDSDSNSESRIPEIAMFCRTIESHDGLNLNLSIWPASNPKATLFYIHGIQSHSGWLFETGPFLAAKGINIVALDRRGSGLSEGMRGHAESVDDLLKDYKRAWEFSLGLSNGIPLTVLGQSFGGSVLAALLCRYDLECNSAIFSAPALGQQRYRYEQYALNSRRARKGLGQVQLSLRDVEYSADEKYLAFIANDVFINRSITSSMASTMVEIEDIYFQNKLDLESIACPVHFIEPLSDSIIDMAFARGVIEPFVALHKHKIDVHSHYMEFSHKRKDLWRIIEKICLSEEHQ